MKKENLLVDCNIKAIRQRLELTLGNIQFQKGYMLWDDQEKLEHCIKALKLIEKKDETNKQRETLNNIFDIYGDVFVKNNNN